MWLHVKRFAELTCGTDGAILSPMVRTGRPKEERTFDRMLRVRLHAEHDDLVRLAADSVARRRGTGDVSSWVREVLVTAARRELAKGEGGPKTAPDV